MTKQPAPMSYPEQYLADLLKRLAEERKGAPPTLSAKRGEVPVTKRAQSTCNANVSYPQAQE